VSSRTKPSRRKNGYPDPNTLSDIVRRVVEAAQPDKIVLFGSAARGEMGPDSDIDLLVIKGGKFNRWRLTTAIYRHLRGKGAPVDVVLVTPEEVPAKVKEVTGQQSTLVASPGGECHEGRYIFSTVWLIEKRLRAVEKSIKPAAGS
jgi:predicted nucleotidyltransferase